MINGNNNKTDVGAHHSKLEAIEQRRHPRFEISAPVSVRQLQGLDRGIVTPAMSVEISEGGISLIFTGSLKIGELIELELQLPSCFLKATGLVRNQTAFRYGVEFNELDHELIDKLKCACQSLPQYFGGSSQY